jgi:hypothetical protein
MHSSAFDCWRVYRWVGVTEALRVPSNAGYPVLQLTRLALSILGELGILPLVAMHFVPFNP